MRRFDMASTLDPQGAETSALLEAVDFNGARVLEIGCGDGRLAFRYASRSRLVVGIESEHEKLISAAKAAVARSRDRVTFVRTDATRLPFVAQSFEIVVFGWSL